SADGLSLYFLLNWFLGDLTNLVGCILTKQLPFQMYLAMYFCTVDLVLFSQYFYYTWLFSARLPDDVPLGPEESPTRFSMISLRDSILEGAKKSYTFPELKKGSHKR
ncbi:33783_t:CDS:2, partial [Racocetra persica]